jgi:DNA-directed RNA polymerase subunit RPC12/RpoP
VQQLINERGQLELDPNMERKDTAEARAFIDKILSVDSEENPAWYNAIADSEELSKARSQLRELKVLAARKMRENEAMATSNPLRFSPVSQVPLPKTEYFCEHCGKKLFFAKGEAIRCDDCGRNVMLKPDTK